MLKQLACLFSCKVFYSLRIWNLVAIMFSFVSLSCFLYPKTCRSRCLCHLEVYGLKLWTWSFYANRAKPSWTIVANQSKTVQLSGPRHHVIMGWFRHHLKAFDLLSCRATWYCQVYGPTLSCIICIGGWWFSPVRVTCKFSKKYTIRTKDKVPVSL